MGLHVVDTDSEYLDEKAQTTTARKQSHCPFVLFRQFCREHREKREQQYRPKIEKIREEVKKSHKEIEASLRTSWQGTTTEQRHELWERRSDATSFRHGNFRFDKSHRYKITCWRTKNGSKKTVIHDFRTPAGCEEAFKWWDGKHLAQQRNGAKYLAVYDAWEVLFQEYIHQFHSNQRKTLLAGEYRVNWTKTTAEALPN